MKRITYHISLAIATFAMLTITGCKKDFLDINRNPNNPVDVDVKFILPSAQANLAYTVGNQLSVVGGLWSQYWTQGPNANQYNDIDRYFYAHTDADRPWRALYAGTLKDLDAMEAKANEEGKQNYAAIAKILRAYTLQLVTDAWGDVPYTEALKGFEGNVNPKYDSQESIYDALPTMIDEGIALLDPSKETPHGDDLMYEGDLLLWYKFANTLKLKVYLRQVNIRPGITAAGIAAMPSDPTEYLESGEDASVHYIDEKFRQNPLYTTVLALGPAKNIFASKTSVDFLTNINDPRLEDYYETTAGGTYVGILQGAARNTALFPPPVNDNNYSQFNETQIIAPDVVVRLMSASESMFLQAEAIARGYMAGDDATTYETAIEDSWNQWSNATSNIGDLPTYLAQSAVAYPASGSTNDKVKAIITQKWIAMNGNQNFESWTEWRRTGFPDFFITSNTSVLGANEFPARLLYSSDELTTNANVMTGKTITDKVWWDVN